jgi:ubiquinone/menaquinone biosynthesis C-methylase UbiE
MTIQEDLKQFYDAEAKKYAQTREKFRSDANVFLDEIARSDEKTIKILEFGCGSGRLLKHMKDIPGKKIQYVGIDLSSELLKIAKKQITAKDKHITATFLCDDITTAIKNYKQESFDYIIGIASFQHIPTRKERFYLMKNFYRLLRYDGKILMTNWSFSSRFLSKFQNEIMKAILKYAISRGKKEWNTIMLPWIAQRQTFWRLYHIFTRKELLALHVLSGFSVEKVTYLDTKGNETGERRQSKNTLTIGQKKVFV